MRRRPRRCPSTARRATRSGRRVARISSGRLNERAERARATAARPRRGARRSAATLRAERCATRARRRERRRRASTARDSRGARDRRSVGHRPRPPTRVEAAREALERRRAPRRSGRAARRRRSRRRSRPSSSRRCRTRAARRRAWRVITVWSASRPSNGMVSSLHELALGRPHDEVVRERDERRVVDLQIAAPVDEDRRAVRVVAEREAASSTLDAAPVAGHGADAGRRRSARAVRRCRRTTASPPPHADRRRARRAAAKRRSSHVALAKCVDTHG